jgi:hypothetical protein
MSGPGVGVNEHEGVALGALGDGLDADMVDQAGAGREGMRVARPFVRTQPRVAGGRGVGQRSSR